MFYSPATASSKAVSIATSIKILETLEKSNDFSRHYDTLRDCQPQVKDLLNESENIDNIKDLAFKLTERSRAYRAHLKLKEDETIVSVSVQLNEANKLNEQM